MLTIADLKNGDRFKVRKVVLAKEIGKRLADMGFTAGAEGVVVRCALLRDPLQVRIYGYNVSIRRSEARGIAVERSALSSRTAAKKAHNP
jgi:Fe2+ transport system protein FeoA